MVTWYTYGPKKYGDSSAFYISVEKRQNPHLYTTSVALIYPTECTFCYQCRVIRNCTKLQSGRET